MALESLYVDLRESVEHCPKVQIGLSQGQSYASQARKCKIAYLVVGGGRHEKMVCATSSTEGSVRIWDLCGKTGLRDYLLCDQVIRVRDAHAKKVGATSVCYSPDGRVVAAGCADGSRKRASAQTKLRISPCFWGCTRAWRRMCGSVRTISRVFFLLGKALTIYIESAFIKNAPRIGGTKDSTREILLLELRFFSSSSREDYKSRLFERQARSSCGASRGARTTICGRTRCSAKRTRRSATRSRRRPTHAASIENVWCLSVVRDVAYEALEGVRMV